MSRLFERSGLLTLWKVNVQGKDGQTNLNIVKIGLSEDGSRAAWLERIEDNKASGIFGKPC